jgi:Arc/MetJ-type ribon-helix-helix transcriptional regulator
MSINLTPEQQNAIEQAIQSGLVRSVDEFIDSALGALSHRNGEFDKAQARFAGCGSHPGQIFENLIEQAVEGCPKRGRGDAQNGD